LFLNPVDGVAVALRWILNTGVDADHVGGNAAVANILGSSRHVELVNTPFSTAVQNGPPKPSSAKRTRFSTTERQSKCSARQRHTRDLFDTDHYPVVDVARGGSLQGIIDGLNRIIDLAIPAYSEEGGTMVIPGNGRICDEIDVVEYRDMLTIIRDRLKAMINKGMTLEQIQGG
jgi:hypothetical protein